MNSSLYLILICITLLFNLSMFKDNIYFLLYYKYSDLLVIIKA